MYAEQGIPAASGQGVCSGKSLLDNGGSAKPFSAARVRGISHRFGYGVCDDMERSNSVYWRLASCRIPSMRPHFGLLMVLRGMDVGGRFRDFGMHQQIT
jgi:hypothetical protein